MCGRYSLSRPDETLRELFGVALEPRAEPRWNVAPTQCVPVVREDAPGVRRAVCLRWGLVPAWATEPSVGSRMINARAETAAAKPAFREALRARRCLVPADGFYEWQGTGRRKQPWLFTLRGGLPLALAGIWERWSGPGGPLETFAVLTTEANDLVRPVHDRMPAVVAPEHFDLWLDPRMRETGRLAPVLRPFPAERMEARPVDAAVNDPRNDDARCFAPPPAGLPLRDASPDGTRSKER